MQYVGIDWAYRRARWCAISERGELTAEATTPADEDGLVRLVARLGPEVRGCIEMMSGAVWVRDSLAGLWLDDSDRRRAQGQGDRAAGLQDRPRRRARARRPRPPRPRPQRVGATA